MLPYTGIEPWSFETLYFSPAIKRGGHVSREACQWLREGVYKHEGSEPTRGARRIYVSRRNAAHARVVNEAKLELSVFRATLDALLRRLD